MDSLSCRGATRDGQHGTAKRGRRQQPSMASQGLPPGSSTAAILTNLLGRVAKLEAPAERSPPGRSWSQAFASANAALPVPEPARETYEEQSRRIACGLLPMRGGDCHLNGNFHHCSEIALCRVCLKASKRDKGVSDPYDGARDYAVSAQLLQQLRACAQSIRKYATHHVYDSHMSHSAIGHQHMEWKVEYIQGIAKSIDGILSRIGRGTQAGQHPEVPHRRPGCRQRPCCANVPCPQCATWRLGVIKMLGGAVRP